MANKENMTYAQVLEEMQRLEVYNADQKRNLPDIVFSVDVGVQAATGRIQVLQGYLDVEETIQEARREVEAEALAASNVLLTELLQDFRDLVDAIDTKAKALHHTDRARVANILVHVTRELR